MVRSMRREHFVTGLVKAHDWRFTLKEGAVVDARKVATRHGMPARWFEARVVSAEKDTIQVHFLGWAPAFDATIGRLSSDIQPLHTFTTAWRELLKKGSIVEARRKVNFNNKKTDEEEEDDDDDDGDGNDDIDDDACDTCVVLAVGENKHTERLLQVIPIKAACTDQQSDERWVSADGEDICAEGTHNHRQLDKHDRNSGITLRHFPRVLSARMSLCRTEELGETETAARRSADASKRVALVGSSGGGAAALGQFDALSLLSLARAELGEAGLELAALQFVGCAEPLDTASPSAAATLWVLDGDIGLVMSARGTLAEINAAAREEDAKIAAGLRASVERDVSTRGNADCKDRQTSIPPLHGLVAISCDVAGANRQAFEAARDTVAPVVGTGGTSLGAALAMGCTVVGSSGGSVATTNKSKVVSYAAGLAGHFHLNYDAGKALTLPFAPAAMFGGCLPSCVGLLVLAGIAERFTDRWGLRDEAGMGELVSQASRAIPVVAAAVAARQISTMADMATAAGIIAGYLCRENILSALIAGTCAGWLCSTLTAMCLTWRVPATSISFYATVPAGAMCGMVVNVSLPFIQVVWAFLASTDVLLCNLQSTWTKATIGAAMGCFVCFGSKVGWYHRAILPVIVLELAAGGGSIWGAIDLCALCMVAAGLCAAHLVRPSTKDDIPLARRGLRINICYGDFIEACYPFMERCNWCNTGGYVGSALSGATVAVSVIPSSAYIPLPVAVMICDKPLSLLAAVSMAFLPAVLFGLSRPLHRLSSKSCGR